MLRGPCVSAQRISAYYSASRQTAIKLGELLNHHPNGLLLFRDELSGWLHTMETDDHVVVDAAGISRQPTTSAPGRHVDYRDDQRDDDEGRSSCPHGPLTAKITHDECSETGDTDHYGGERSDRSSGHRPLDSRTRAGASITPSGWLHT